MEEVFIPMAQNPTPSERIDAFNTYIDKDSFLYHDAEELGRVQAEGRLKWLVGDYEAGDVVFHNPYMIYAATKNEDNLGRIRLVGLGWPQIYDLTRKWLRRMSGG